MIFFYLSDYIIKEHFNESYKYKALKINFFYFYKNNYDSL